MLGYRAKLEEALRQAPFHMAVAVILPEHMTPAKTQHWPYLTVRKLLFFHMERMSWLPLQWDGDSPPSKESDQLPIKTPLSSGLLI